MDLEVGDRIEDIYYASEEHRNETFLALSFEDKGEVIVIDNGLEFRGDSSNIKMRNVQDILMIDNGSRNLGKWIQIRYLDEKKVLQAANLIILGDEVLMGKEKEKTTDFFHDLLKLKSSWNG